MPGEVIIGSVSIKVLPELSSFRRDTEVQLNAVEKTLPEVDVEVKPDTRGLVTKINKAVAIAQGTAGTVKIGVDVNNTSALAALTRLNTMIESTRQRIHVDIETTSVNKLLKDTRGKIAEVTRQVVADREQIIGRFKFEVGLDKGKTRAELEAHMKELEAVLRPLEIELSTTLSPERRARLEAQIALIKQDIDEINLMITPTVNKAMLLSAKAKLAELSKSRTAEIYVKVNKASALAAGTALSRISGLRMLWELHKAKFQALANFDKLAVKIAKVSASLALLSVYLAAAAGNALSLVNGLGSIVPLVTVLPGMLAGLGLAFWSVKVAFKDFNKILPGFKSSMDELKQAMSVSFWKKAKMPIQNFLSTIFPQFGTAMRKIAEATGGYIGALARTMTKELDGRVKPMLGNVSKAFDIMAKSAASTSRWVRILLEIGLQQLPRFANWWNTINERFANFMTQASKSGKLQEWIDTAIVNLNHLGSILFNIGKVFYNLGAIAEGAGASTLASLDATMQKMAAITSSPAFVEGLGNVLVSVYDTIDTVAVAIEGRIGALATKLSVTIPQMLSAIAGPVGEALAGFLGGLTSDTFQTGLLTLFTGIGTAIKALAPVMGILAEKIGIVLGLAGDVVAQMGPLLAAFIKELASVLTTVGPAFSEALKVIGPAILGAFEAIAPVVLLMAQIAAQILPIIANLIQQLATGLAPILASVGTALGTILSDAIKVIGPMLPPLVDAIMALFAAVAPLLPLLAQLFVNIMAAAIPVVTEIVKAIAEFVKKLMPVISFLMPIINWLVTTAIGIIGDTILGLINGISNVVEGVINVVMGIWNFLKDLFTGQWGKLWDDVLQIFTGLWQILVGLFQVYIYGSFVKVMASGIMALKALWKLGWEGILAFFKIIWEALTTGFKWYFGTIKTIVTTVIDAIKVFFGGGWKTILSTALEFLGKLVSATGSKIGEVGKFFKELPGKAVQWIKDGVQLLWNAGADLIAGLVGGIASSFDTVKRKLGELTAFLPDWKGPASTDRKILRPAGQLVMEGFISGLLDKKADLKDTLGEFTKMVANTDFKLGTIDTSSITDMAGFTGTLATAIPSNANAGTVNNTIISMSGSDLTPSDVANELLGAYRRVNRGGVYGRRV